MADRQRQKCYDAEHAAIRRWELAHGTMPVLTPADAKDLIDEVVADSGQVSRIELKLNSRLRYKAWAQNTNGGAFHGPRRIEINANGLTRSLLLHEIAHHHASSKVGHDALWVGEYLELVKKWMPDFHELLATEFACRKLEARLPFILAEVELPHHLVTAEHRHYAAGQVADRRRHPRYVVNCMEHGKQKPTIGRQCLTCLKEGRARRAAAEARQVEEREARRAVWFAREGERERVAVTIVRQV